MEGLNYAKLMDLFNAQTGTVNILWNIFVAVSFGILGFVLKEKELRENWMIKLVFTLGFIAIAYGNFEAMSRSQAVLVAIAKTLQSAADTDNAKVAEFRSVLQAHQAISVSAIMRAHLIATTLVAIAIWLPDIVASIQRRLRARKVGA